MTCFIRDFNSFRGSCLYSSVMLTNNSLVSTNNSLMSSYWGRWLVVFPTGHCPSQGIFPENFDNYPALLECRAQLWTFMDKGPPRCPSQHVGAMMAWRGKSWEPRGSSLVGPWIPSLFLLTQLSMCY